MGPVCAGLKASIRTTLAPGIYYIVSEGYSTNSGSITTSVSIVVQAPPAPVVYDTRNYIRAWDATAPEQDANFLVNKTLRDVKQNTVYFDGLGRPEQTVVKKGSLITETGALADIVSPVVYDEFGREAQKYLTYVSPTSNGLYKSSAITEQNNFYTGTNSPVYGQGETFFHSKTNFEASPLNRVEKSMAPGNSWVGNNRGVDAKYWINTVTDDVKIWDVTNSASPDIFATYAISSSVEGGAYPAGELYKNATVDEHGKQVIEFKDKEGKVILKKVQLVNGIEDDGSGRNYPGWLCTYYIYDDLNNLRCVIQPEAVKKMSDASNWSLVNNLDEQCFRYEYDSRNRMIMKKVPGAGEVYMVYDERDRLVMTQDANMRAINKWMVTLFDEVNRPVQTGLLLNSWNNKLFTNHLTDAAINSTGYPFTPATVPSFTYWEYLMKTGYDDYATIPAASGLNNTIDLTNINNTYGFYTMYNASPDYAQEIPSTPSFQTKGMVTWTETKVLNSTSYLYSVILYDEKGRAVQIKSKNTTGGVDLATTQYNWGGQPLIMLQKLEKGGTASQTSIAVTKISYDDLSRVSQIDKKIQNNNVNGNELPTSWTTIAKNEYDALGQLKIKTIGSKKDPTTGTYYTTRQPSQELKYDYNIRGWMLGMNRDYLAAEGQTYDGELFGFELGYDKPNDKSTRNFTGAGEFNGNISGMVWKSDGDDIRRKYDFRYDGANRLLKAEFEQHNGDNHLWNNYQVNYMVKMGDGADPLLAYDANGNIKRMQQWGLNLNTSSPIDDLSYHYNLNSNKLISVSEVILGSTDNKLGDFTDKNTSNDDYSYDYNGNLTLDKNKLISNISYNYLNLPSVITVTGKGTITYSYDAAGNKLKKEVAESGQPIKTTLYVGGAVYENDVLQFIGHEEGQIRYKPAIAFTNASFEYDYMIKDHLGNVRMVLTEEQQQDIYPAATLEGNINTDGNPNAIFKEKNYYTVNPSNVVDKSQATGITDYINKNGGTNATDPPVNNNPNSLTTANSQKLYKLIATSNGGVTGLGITLKVMSGDRIDVFGNSYYFENNTNNDNNFQVPVLDILGGLLGGPASVGVTGAHGVVTSGQLNSNSGSTGLITSLLTQQATENASTPTKPRAYINYLVFDEQFNCVKKGFSQVGNSNSIKIDHFNDLQNIAIEKNGYIYIYCSNESPVNVFFDNLQAIHTRGPILEETHYYPFGLTMAGISSKAASSIENLKKYNGIELENDLELNIYNAQLRELDPQIGRWWQIDPKIDEMFMWSTYASNFDNPIKYADPLGDMPDDCCKELLDAVVETADQLMASASGLFWGSLNTTTGGLVSTDPFNIRPGLSSTTQQIFDKSIEYGKILPFFSPGSTRSAPRGRVVEMVPAGGRPNFKTVVPTPSVPTVFPPSSPKQSSTAASNNQQMKGERNRAGKASGTDNPFKKLKPDPNRAGNVILKDANGKTVSKKAPEGFWEYWNKKHN